MICIGFRGGAIMTLYEAKVKASPLPKAETAYR